MTLAELCRQKNLNYNTMWRLINIKGMSVEEAVENYPTRGGQKVVEYKKPRKHVKREHINRSDENDRFILTNLKIFKQWGVIGLLKESFKMTRYFNNYQDALNYMRKVK